MDAALNKNESELGVFVASALLQMLSDVHSLLDQMVKVFRDLWSQALFLQDSEDFAASDALHLWNASRVPESDTNLRRSIALLCELHDRVDEIVGGNSDP